MLNGTAGIRYRVVFATKAFVKNISVDEIWINNKHYNLRAPSPAAVAVHYDSTYAEKVLFIDLNDETEQKGSDPIVKQIQKFVPGNVPLGHGDLVIVYTVGSKKKYHIISQVEKLPYAVVN